MSFGPRRLCMCVSVTSSLSLSLSITQAQRSFFFAERRCNAIMDSATNDMIYPLPTEFLCFALDDVFKNCQLLLESSLSLVDEKVKMCYFVVNLLTHFHTVLLHTG